MPCAQDKFKVFQADAVQVSKLRKLIGQLLEDNKAFGERRREQAEEYEVGGPGTGGINVITVL